MANSATDRSERSGSCSTAATPDSATSSETGVETLIEGPLDHGPPPARSAERPTGRAPDLNKKSSYRPARAPAPNHVQQPRARCGVLDVDLAAIVANWRALDRLGAAETATVVKADAYGCGADRVAPALSAAGCRTFFTATRDEAGRVADALGARDASIYVLNGFAPSAAGDPRIRPVLNTLAEAIAWDAARPGAAAALQIETGMNRIGLTLDEQAALRAGATPTLHATLILSHLASAATVDDPLLRAQKAGFDQALPALRARFPIAKASLAATQAALLGPAYGYDMIRPGVGLYGGLPFADARPVARLAAPLLRVWSVAEGERSGYGGDWIAARPSRLATVPLGYADGLPRALGGRGRARIDGRAVPIAGRISMDLTVLDVTGLDPAPVPGDWAHLLDETLTVDALAQDAGTIGYEILTRLDAARRLERRYLT